MDEVTDLTFSLFRIQVHKPRQVDAFHSLVEPSVLLREAVRERPEIFRWGRSWLIGNLHDLDPESLYFALGKQLPREVSVLDDARDFRSFPLVVAPNTHVLLDLRYQVLAIAKNPTVSQRLGTIANRLAEIVESSRAVQKSGCSISVAAIDDPTNFVDQVWSAVTVNRLKVIYSLPNVWDVEKDFQRPFQQATQELNSREGAAQFSGEDLNRSSVIKLARAATAIGRSATAWIRRDNTAKLTKVSTSGNQATQSANDVDESQPMRWAVGTIASIRSLYESIRRRE
ncbi:MAG: hypothetical protein ACK5S2_12090 [Lysobacteraceae bacterium]|jgi:hypothetical protein|nr:hypothetical protein [Silanimonas sp.]